MCDIFTTQDVKNLLYNKFVVIIGDSIQRGIYKDLVTVIQNNRYLTRKELRSKGELTFENDELIEGGVKNQLTNGTSYQEVRQYQTDVHLIRFYFVTRCYSNYMESILMDLSKEPRPDVVVMNSCLWDITRYGNTAIAQYKENLKILFSRFQQVLHRETLFIWNTTMPISKYARGGFLIPEIEFKNSTLRLDVLEANFYAHKLLAEMGFDVIDLHYYFRVQLHRQTDDGIHWDSEAHRRITNILLTHISEAWGVPLPCNNIRHIAVAPAIESNSCLSVDSINGLRESQLQGEKDTGPNHSQLIVGQITKGSLDSRPSNFAVAGSKGGNYVSWQYHSNAWQEYQQADFIGCSRKRRKSRQKARQKYYRRKC